jgi:hypothetical protein
LSKELLHPDRSCVSLGKFLGGREIVPHVVIP